MKNIKNFAAEERGLVSVFVVVLLMIMTVIVMNVARLQQEDRQHSNFILERIELNNELLSAANEIRWRVYGGESFAAGRHVLGQGKVYPKQKLPKEIVGEFFPAQGDASKGGQWSFYTYNDRMVPRLRWVYRQEQGKIIQSRWARDGM